MSGTALLAGALLSLQIGGQIATYFRAPLTGLEKPIQQLSTSGTNFVAQIQNGDLRSFELHPEQVGLKVTDPKDLLGGEPADNAAAMIALFEGAPGAYRDTVLLNAGAALLVADKVSSVEDGIALARTTIDSGKAKDVLARLVSVSNG